MTLWDFLDHNIWYVLAFMFITLIAITFLLIKLRPSDIGPLKFQKKQAEEIADRYLRSVEKIRELQRRISVIEEVETMRDQMRVADNILDDFLRRAKQVHLELMNQRVTDDTYKQYVEELNTYSLRIELATEDIKREIRRSFRENHFTEKTPSEFSAYVSERLKILFRIVEDAIDYRYFSNILPIELLRETNRQKTPEYRESLESIYTQAKEISIAKKCEAQFYYEKIALIVSRYLSREPLGEDLNGLDGCFDTKER